MDVWTTERKGTDDIPRCLAPDHPEAELGLGLPRRRLYRNVRPDFSRTKLPRANANPHKHLLVGNVRGWGGRGSLTSDLAALLLVRPLSRGVL